MLAGNRAGVTVGLMEPQPSGRYAVRLVNAFASRCFTSISDPDPTLASRCLILPLIPSGDPLRANLEVDDDDRWPEPPRDLRDDCWALALSLLPEAPTAWREAADDVDRIGRDGEPWRAALATALLLERHGAAGCLAAIKALAQAEQARREAIGRDDRNRAIVRALAVVAAGKLPADKLASDLRHRLGSDGHDVHDVSGVYDVLWSIAQKEDAQLSFLPGGAPGPRTEIRLTPSEVEAALLETWADDPADAPAWMRARSLGWAFGKLSLPADRAASGGKRRERVVTPAWLCRLMRAYRLHQPPAASADTSAGDATRCRHDTSAPSQGAPPRNTS